MCRLSWAKTQQTRELQQASWLTPLGQSTTKPHTGFSRQRSYHTHVGECVRVWARPRCVCLHLHVSNRVNRPVSTSGLRDKRGGCSQEWFSPRRKIKKHQKMPFSWNCVLFFLPTFKFTHCEHMNKLSYTEFVFLSLHLLQMPKISTAYLLLALKFL